MAFLIPENLGSRSDVRGTVQEVAKLFRDATGDAVTVYLDVDEQVEDVPLWILDPDHGLLALYVLDNGRRSFQQRLKERLGRDLRIPEITQGAVQAAQPVLSRLASSPHLVRAVPTKVIVALPSVGTADLQRAGTDMSIVLAAEDLRPAAIQDALDRVFSGTRIELSASEQQVARAAVDRRIIIRDAYDEASSLSGIAFRAPGEGEGSDLAVLDRTQQRLAFHLGDGYRVIRGVAGSGKSLILTARARHLVDRSPGCRVLITCYNVIIAAALAEEVADLPTVEVRNIDSFAWRVQKDLGRRAPTGDDKWDRIREIAAEHVSSQRCSAEFKYDAVLVDEGQDFDPLMLDIAHGALRDPDGDFVIAIDGVQNIYRRSGKAWRANGRTAQGRTTMLRVNYRNTHEILDLAYALLERGQAQDASGEGSIQEDSEVVRPEATSRRGARPQVVAATSVEAEVRAACDQIERWHRHDGIAWEDILVLFGDQRRYQGKLYYECDRRGIPYFCATLSSKTRRQIVTVGDVVRSASIMSAKGIEFPRVVVLGANQVSIGPESDETDHRRLVYVAMTRATDHLMLTVSGQGPVAGDLLTLAS
jgi:hypothetical protein